MNVFNFLLCTIVVVSLFNATLILTLQKWGWFDYYEAHKPVWLKWVKQCVFCFGFRMAVIEVIIIACFIPSWFLIVVPFCCTSLTFLIVSK